MMKAAAARKPTLPLLILAVLLFSCSTAKKDAVQEAVSPGEQAAELAAAVQETTEPDPAPPPSPRIALIPEQVRPGEPVTLAFLPADDGAPGDYRAALLNSRGERIAKAAFFSLGNSLEGEAPEALAAIMAVPSAALPGEALARIERDGAAIGEIAFAIAGREFAAEEIALDQQNTDIRTAPDPQKTAESDQLWGIINRTGTEAFAEGPFVPPVSSTRRTSFYGDRRVYRYVTGKTDAAIHAGVDYGVPTGTEVRACAAGRVALARFRIATGNSVILEHLPGVYSLYYHLDSIQVAEGDIAKAGDLLGKSGSTGLATGPHLHWEIRVSGENADPDAFIARAVLDKAAILSKLR
jgi:murein DD-endopeptidase MepM/ murein hydrolase activator NlpD